MSFQTWKKEFYPVRPTKKMTTIQAIEHSIQKWEGLKKENLKKHEVNLGYDNRTVSGEDKGKLDIDITSCALCVKFRFKDDEYWEELEDDEVYVDKGDICQNCPLYLSRGGYACDNSTPKEQEKADENSGFSRDYHPYGQLCTYANPLPMLRELKKTLKMVQKQESKK